MVVLVTSNNVEDLIKNEGAKVATTLHNDFSKTLKGSLLHSQRSNLVEILIHLKYYGCPCYFQE